MLAINEQALQELYRCYAAEGAEGGSGLNKMLRTLRLTTDSRWTTQLILGSSLFSSLPSPPLPQSGSRTFPRSVTS
jgi:hypothetical protein